MNFGGSFMKLGIAFAYVKAITCAVVISQQAGFAGDNLTQSRYCESLAFGRGFFFLGGENDALAFSSRG